jgi:hypothetical protein
MGLKQKQTHALPIPILGYVSFPSVKIATPSAFESKRKCLQQEGGGGGGPGEAREGKGSVAAEREA